MKKEFYIYEIDEVLAELYLNVKSPLNIKMSHFPDSGFINAECVESDHKTFESGIDFELSTSECCGLNDIELGDYLNRTVHTSSAFEFFDFVFAHSKKVDVDVEFTDDCWKIRINGCG